MKKNSDIQALNDLKDMIFCEIEMNSNPLFRGLLDNWFQKRRGEPSLNTSNDVYLFIQNLNKSYGNKTISQLGGNLLQSEQHQRGPVGDELKSDLLFLIDAINTQTETTSARTLAELINSLDNPESLNNEINQVIISDLLEAYGNETLNKLKDFDDFKQTIDGLQK